MPYLLLDDIYDQNPKVLALTEVERWRWTRVLLHCSRHRTGGRVDDAVLAYLGLSKSVPKLIERGLLVQLNDVTYAVHDWFLYNGGLSVEERVAYYLDEHPGASANEVARAIPVRRQLVLAAVTRLNGGTA